MDREPHVLPAMVQALVFRAIRAGLDPVGLLERSGVELATIESEAPVPYSQVLAIIREIERVRPQVNLGLHMGMAFGTRRMHVLGCALAHAPRVGIALEDFVRFQHVVNAGLFAWALSEVGEMCVVQLAAPPAWLADFRDVAWPSEAPIAMVMSLVRELCGRRVTPREVSFCHRARNSTVDHEAFFGIPVQFDAADNQIVFPREVLDLPVPNANVALYRHLLQHVETSLGPISRGPTTTQAVRRHIMSHLGQGKPRKSSVARANAMSSRTLLRRLHGEGTSFESLLDEVRRDMALAYVADETIPLAEVASRLGYSEPSPFFRAFSRWFGRTPMSHRANVRRQFQASR